MKKEIKIKTKLEKKTNKCSNPKGNRVYRVCGTESETYHEHFTRMKGCICTFCGTYGPPLFTPEEWDTKFEYHLAELHKLKELRVKGLHY